MGDIARLPVHYILELESGQVDVLVQMAHMYLVNQPKHEAALGALESLRVQTNRANGGPTDYKVYPDPLKAPERAIRFNGMFYVPL